MVRIAPLLHRLRHTAWMAVAALVALAALAACQTLATRPAAPPAQGDSSTAVPAAAPTLVIYSGRNENLVGPLIERFRAESGLQVDVRYGGTAEMAATIIEEGRNSPADLFFGQDAGALGALSRAGRLAPLPAEILALVDPALRSRQSDWVGISGRARVLVYNTQRLTEADLPSDIWGLTDAQWQGEVGWAPTNGSFQAFVTALIVLEGEERAREWLQAMIANGVQSYPNNTTIVEATARGEVSLGLVNHYYLYRFLAEQGESYPARNYHFPTPGAGSMINVAGAAILDTAPNPEAAGAFLTFLLTPEAQSYFATETNEYPLIPGVALSPLLKSLAEVQMPSLDLSDLDDLQSTLELLQEVGALD